MDLTTTLLAASKADKNAEAQLHQWTEQNYVQIAPALARELASEDKPEQTRTSAGLFLKNTLYGKSVKTQQALHARWKSLPSETRKSVKDSLMLALRSNLPSITHFGAIAASEVAAVELPYREWQELLPTLTANLEAAPHIQQAAFECLGYSLERMGELEETIPGWPELQTDLVDKMLTTIVNGVSPTKPEPIRIRALTALRNSLVFVKKNMQVAEERNFIMRQALMEATRAPDVSIRKMAFESLDQVAELYYEHLQDYMSNIFELTTQAIRSDPDESVKIAAIEFWSTVATVEMSIIDEQTLGGNPAVACQYYTKSALPNLVPLILETLSQQDEHIEEDEIDLHSTGALCLQTISQTVEDIIIPSVMPFVNQHISSDNWRMRDAAIVAFSCILDGPDTQAVSQFVSQSIPVLLQCFEDPNETVRQSAIFCMSTICKLHAVAIQPAQVHGILECLLKKLAESPKVASQACSAIYNIARSLRDESEQDTNLMSQPMMMLLQSLFQVCDRSDAGEHNLRATSLEAAAEVISSAARDVHIILVQVLPNVIDRVEAAFKMPSVSKEENDEKFQLLSNWCILYQALLRQLPKEAVLPHADRCMATLLQILQMDNSMSHDEAFMAIGSLVDNIEGDFAKYLDYTIPAIIKGISKFEETNSCKTAIGTLVDISVNCGRELPRFGDQLVGVLFECLKDGSADRTLKPVVISCLGDLAMALQGAYEPYMQVTAMLLMQAAQQQAPADDEDLLGFINELRLAVLEAYMGILIAFEDGNKLHLYMQLLQNIIAFLQYLSTPASCADEQVVVKAVTLLGDIARLLGSQDSVKAALKAPFILQLLTICTDGSTATWTHEQVTAAVKQ